LFREKGEIASPEVSTKSSRNSAGKFVVIQGTQIEGNFFIKRGQDKGNQVW